MWPVRYEAEGDGNPKAPKDQLVRTPQVRLPEARLARLGVADTVTLAIYRAWWDDLTDAAVRAAAVQGLAVLSDSQLAAQAAQLGELPTSSAAHVEAWARRQPNREIAAGLATAAERSRHQPRPGVLKKLAAIR